jgi:hypothetical protein
MEGRVANKIYNLSAVVKTPGLLINGLTTIYDSSLKPILAKNVNKEFIVDIASLDQLMNNVKENGFNALSVFHKGGKLDENEMLEADIVVNLQNFEFKVNDKGVLDILTDDNIIKFLQGMPKDHETK